MTKIIFLVILYLTGCGSTDGKISYTSETNSTTPCKLNSISDGPCLIEKNNIAISDMLGSDIIAWNNNSGSTNILAPIPQGYYVNKNVVFNEPNLVSSNIISGVNIFGVSGSATNVLSTCSSDGLQSTNCKASANTYWTSVAGNNITTGSNLAGSTTVSAVIPDGYYKNNIVSFTDANLVSTKILLGQTIFGVTGSVPTTYSACTDDTLNASSCSTVVNRYVTSGSGGNISITMGTVANISTGFYSGKKCIVNDANLSANNITMGTVILGITGNRAPAYAACNNDNFTSGQCSTPASGYYTATLGSAISSWTNVSSGTVVSGSIPLGFYPNNTAINFTDINLISTNIKAGLGIFNVQGFYYGPDMSTMSRDKNTTQITQTTESLSNGGTVYTNADPGYRAVPKMSKDDDGGKGSSTTTVSRTNWDNSCDSVTGRADSGTGPFNTICKCGLTGTIDQRISDCATHTIIGPYASWDGSLKGNSGEGNWKLVTRTNAVSASKGREVWQDGHSKLLWSSLVQTNFNWCKASGSNNITGNPTAENDLTNYCNNSTYQTTGTAPTNKAISACFEDDGTYFTQTGTDQAGKAGLNLTSTPKVAWRLPTKSDYQRADVHGLRFVMPDTNINGIGEWAATVSSFYRNQAFIYWGDDGSIFYGERGTFANVGARCVGR